MSRESRAREQAAVLILTEAAPGESWRAATMIAECGSALTLLSGAWKPRQEVHRRYVEDLLSRASADELDHQIAFIAEMAGQGLHLSTILDDDYPTNLHLVHNRPPFIWIRGGIEPTDARSVAVVGTRQATPTGLAVAASLSERLVEAGYTVISGLAAGIDTAAHTAALRVGGRTIAVTGNGLLQPTYPSHNAGLADRIAAHSAVVSQFMPHAPPRRYTFPQRNIVMSGLALGTVVVEASHTSGAKMQARFAIEHGKRLFLPATLVETQEWARRYAERAGVDVIHKADEIIDTLDGLLAAPEQLTLMF